MSTWTFYTVGGASLTVCPITALYWSHSRIRTLWTSRALCTASGILYNWERTIRTRKMVGKLLRWTLRTNWTRMAVGAPRWSKTSITAWNRIFWVHSAAGKINLRSNISYICHGCTIFFCSWIYVHRKTLYFAATHLWPSGHTIQSAAEPLLYVPLGQSSGAWAGFGHLWPAGQLWQLVWLTLSV